MKTPHGRAAVKDESAAYATEAIWEGAAGARGLSQKTCTEWASPRELAQRSARGPLHGSGVFFIYKFTAECMEGCNISAQNNALRG